MTRAHATFLSGAVSLVLAVSIATVATAEVIARGQLVPSGGPGVRRVRIWGALEIYISSETALPTMDVITSLVFAVLAGAMGFAAIALANGGIRDDRLLCVALISILAAYLSADELLAIHESTGHNLQFLRALPGVERPDDVVLAAYGVPVAVFAWLFRRILFAVRASTWLFVAAIGASALGVVADVAAAGRVEEWLEVVAAVAFSAGAVVLAAVVVPDALLHPVVSMASDDEAR